MGKIEKINKYKDKRFPDKVSSTPRSFTSWKYSFNNKLVEIIKSSFKNKLMDIKKQMVGYQLLYTARQRLVDTKIGNW